MEENPVHYNNNALPQLQLFANVPIQCGAGVGTVNHICNRSAPTDNHAMNRGGEGEALSMQQKLHISLNNNCFPDEAGRIGTVLDPSTGLKLSSEVEEHNSSVTSACENIKNNVPVMLSLGNTVKLEIDRRTEELGQYIKLQEENILKGVREINQRHAVSLLTALEKGVKRKMQEKEVQVENMNRKNKELGDRIRQVAMEAQSWHYRAKHNESVVNALKSNIRQLMERETARAHEGSGDSEVDDALSSSNHQRIVSDFRNGGPQNDHPPPRCRACHREEVSVLILPYRHLCLCTGCEGFVDVCPVCQVMKTASVHVYVVAKKCIRAPAIIITEICLWSCTNLLFTRIAYE